jgi:hypothetical protein
MWLEKEKEKWMDGWRGKRNLRKECSYQRWSETIRKKKTVPISQSAKPIRNHLTSDFVTSQSIASHPKKTKPQNHKPQTHKTTTQHPSTHSTVFPGWTILTILSV